MAVLGLFILIFTSLAIPFNRRMLRLERFGTAGTGEKPNWRPLVFALYASLASITTRIIFRLIQYSSRHSQQSCHTRSLLLHSRRASHVPFDCTDECDSSRSNSNRRRCRISQTLSQRKEGVQAPEKEVKNVGKEGKYPERMRLYCGRRKKPLGVIPLQLQVGRAYSVVIGLSISNMGESIYIMCILVSSLVISIPSISIPSISFSVVNCAPSKLMPFLIHILPLP